MRAALRRLQGDFAYAHLSALGATSYLQLIVSNLINGLEERESWAHIQWRTVAFCDKSLFVNYHYEKVDVCGEEEKEDTTSSLL
ncbi:hypothetical protein ElyMa_004937700 [Elysia marginata]|uniref:Uncharacterized protein n=1 Tax=Elysia marginata TaxID=1093978 RepID=A0AAV4J2V9_9GAST|nr:hypothetical protein ElyMa_004937700 [Elysia marginata]